MENQVGIVTWMGYPNFGTYLQACALRTVLEREGFACRFVDDTDFSIAYIRRRYRHPNPLRRFLSRTYNLLLPRTLRSKEFRRYTRLNARSLDLFSQFREKHLPMLDDPRSVPTYIAGSDQIWSATAPLEPDYLRHFFLADFQGTKIAYAPSLGIAPDLESDYISMVRPWLKEFKAISAREPQGARILAEAVGHEVPVMLDPTLLLDRKDWLAFMHEEVTLPEENYCFCYLLTYNPRIIAQAEEYAARNGQKLVVVLNHPQLLRHSFTTVSVGPAGFLYLLDNATSFITDSFHGTIFATLFDVPSVTFRRFSNDEPNRQNRRLEHFFRLIGSQKRMISADEQLTDEMVATEPSGLRRRLDGLRKESMSFLTDNLKSISNER